MSVQRYTGQPLVNGMVIASGVDGVIGRPMLVIEETKKFVYVTDANPELPYHKERRAKAAIAFIFDTRGAGDRAFSLSLEHRRREREIADQQLKEAADRLRSTMLAIMETC